jgi:NAD(P)H-dependent flavin oxidoreductase YrpB (nitropropane dioxygenase family)
VKALGTLSDCYFLNCRLFVSAVGVPPRWAVDKLHKAGIPVMNMIGSPKHVKKCIDAGVDIICAQGGEGGGHTGEIASSILIPKVVDLCKNAISPLTGDQVWVVAAGGIFDGRGLACALAYGAQAVWVGTRFVCAKEAGAPPRHQQAIVNAGYHDTIRTVIYTGRPMRVLKTEYISNWEDNRPTEIKQLISNGVIPINYDMEERAKKNEQITPQMINLVRPLLMGQVAGAINDIKPAAEIINEMVNDAVHVLRELASNIRPVAKL